jgi:excinuclease ABC subunit A
MPVVPMHSYNSGEKWFHSDEQIKDLIIQNFTKTNVLAPIIRARKGHYAEFFNKLPNKVCKSS